jgi:squalene-hopene/tetraprenyl-beta-curcumene cyclase
LLDKQASDGHWVGELQGDTILESEYVILMAFLGREHEARVAKAARYILNQQLPDGGWSNYPGGPADLTISVKAYFALKLAGHDASASYMRRACTVIRSIGGAEQCNSFAKYYLALLGQHPYGNCPSVPPELILLPRWAYINLYAMSAWTRTIVVPLSIVCGHRPIRKLPAQLCIPELFLDSPDKPRWPHTPTSHLFTWTNFFLAIDQGLKLLGSFVMRPVRRVALNRAKKWLLEHLEDSDGLGAIFPPIVYTIISLRCFGYSGDSREMRWAIKQLEELIIEDEETVRLQPCFSPVWDTALTLIALADGGVRATQPAIERASCWLLDREVRRPGDWSLANPDLEPAGWFFEYRNGFYPDTDDTAMVLMALAKSGQATTPEGRAAAERGVRWLRGMQNDDGGWAAFDRNINRQILTKVPFADHNAILDPSCPDITGRALEALGHFGYRVGNNAVDRAVRFLAATQDPRGCWLGRWGINYVYGTWQVLAGLASIGYDMAQPMVRRAVDWLKSVQHPSGGWGESPRTYDDPTLAGQGTPTASQTAWALMGLLAAGEAHSDEVQAGIDCLLASQQRDGSWHEEQFTGTGFPRVFYLKYHMYSVYFPMIALARYQSALGNRPIRLELKDLGQRNGKHGHDAA